MALVLLQMIFTHDIAAQESDINKICFIFRLNYSAEAVRSRISQFLGHLQFGFK